MSGFASFIFHRALSRKTLLIRRDHRALSGVSKAHPSFQGQPVHYTCYQPTHSFPPLLLDTNCFIPRAWRISSYPAPCSKITSKKLKKKKKNIKKL